MKILITGGCGFVGSNLAIYLKNKLLNVTINTLDNLSRKGTVLNYKRLKKNKIKNYKIDIKNFKALKKLSKFDLVIDCCAESAIETSEKEIDKVINTNLIGTLNILKKCAKDNSNIIFLSSSRVYEIKNLRLIKKPKIAINENFSTIEAKSIYGFTKLSSEFLIKEFSYIYKLKYIINRLGVISGPWQFGKQEQGFVSLWTWQHLNKGKLKYIGFGGQGKQTRDIIHIDDVCSLIFLQINKMKKINNITLNVGGGKKNTSSLFQLTKICQKITKNKTKILSKKMTSIYDVPNYTTNNLRVKKIYNWMPKKNVHQIVYDTYIWMKMNKKKLSKYFI